MSGPSPARAGLGLAAGLRRCILLGLLPASAWAQPLSRPADEPQELGRLSRSLEALSERVRPAVVQIFTTSHALDSGGLARQRTSGSGVILDPDGYVVTNAHVVEGARSVRVMLAGLPGPPPDAHSVLKAPGRVVGAQVVGADRETDLAVLKLEEKELPFLQLGDSEELRQGQIVLAFGSPLGLANSVTLGVVSAVARQLRPDDRMIYVQTDASINPGNSGGPLVDGAGRVVGINTFILSQSGGNEGIGFAAPSNIVRRVFEQIRATGRVRRGEIGVRAQSVTPALAAGLGLPQEWGVVLADVRPDGPADRAGLRILDLVLELDGKPMENARQLQVNLYLRPVGGRVGLAVRRASQKLLFLVPVAERPGDPEQLAERVSAERNGLPRLGVLGLDLDEELGRLLAPLRAGAGVVVASADPDGPARADPLQPGDVIYSVNQRGVSSVAQLREALAALGPAAPVVLQVERQGELRLVAVEPE